MTEVDFYYDFACPWSFIALVRLQDVCERNRARIAFKPVCVRNVLKTEAPELADEPLSDNPAKAAWQLKDLQDWARFWGLEINLDDSWPVNRDRAAAASLAAADAGQGIVFNLRLFRAAFSAGEDINTDTVLAREAEALGLDAKVVLQAADKRLDEIQAFSRELIERGGFGTPSMFIGDALYFGNDRIPLIEWMLGPISDGDFVIPGQHNG